MKKRTPIIDVTDLYHPYQDPGDNVDILAPYHLAEIDLRAVILDATERFRHAFADHENPHYRDHHGPREPGIIPMTQVNYIHGRAVPFHHGPFRPMQSPEETYQDAPAGEQFGIDLILQTLRQSQEKVSILVFSSCRAVAAAYNREPNLFHEKVERLHLSAGSSGAYLEWNVMLDPLAFARLIRSPLPVTVYPCAGPGGPFELDKHNTYWRLEGMGFIRRMSPKLRNYLCFVFDRSVRKDFLACLHGAPPEPLLENLEMVEHNVWETQIWFLVAGRRLVVDRTGKTGIVSKEAMTPEMEDLTGETIPAEMSVTDEGIFSFTPHVGDGLKRVYHRADPERQQEALRKVFPLWYEGFRP